MALRSKVPRILPRRTLLWTVHVLINNFIQEILDLQNWTATFEFLRMRKYFLCYSPSTVTISLKNLSSALYPKISGECCKVVTMKKMASNKLCKKSKLSTFTENVMTCKFLAFLQLQTWGKAVGLQQLVFTGEAFIMRFGYEIGHLKPNSIMFVRYLKIINTLQEKEHASWSKLSEELHKLIRWLVVVLLKVKFCTKAILELQWALG